MPLRRAPLGAGRCANPFIAEAHAPGAIPWLDRDGRCADHELDAILDAMVRRTHAGDVAHGQITGPHGVGKTTLLTHLAQRARARGWSVTESRPPDVRWPARSPDARDRAMPRLACIDSADQMTRVQWAMVRVRARVDGATLLVTTHRDLSLFNVANLGMSVALARCVLRRVADPARIALPNDDELARMLQRHQGSLRHVIFELYDHFERGWPW